MCLGVPGKIVETIEERDGLRFGVVEFDGLRRTVCLECVPDAAPGEYVIVHAGVAITRLDAEEAERLLQILRSLAEAGDEAH
jgi:hydrogenase expression/formation protein HypC